MLYITLPGTDLKVSAACLGTAEFGGDYDEAFSMRQLDRFCEAGGNFIDTAHMYNDWHPGERGRSEKLIGKWLRQSHRDCVIATKGAHPPLDDMAHSRVTREDITRDLDESLAGLGVERIDLYFLHRDDPSVPAGEIVEWMNGHIRQGKIAHWGCSNWTLARIIAANEYAREHGLRGIACNQTMWSYASFDPGAIADKTLIPADKEMLAYHGEQQLSLMAFTSQAKGYLSKRAAGAPISQSVSSVYGVAENDVKAERLLVMQKETGLTVGQLCLLYFLSLPFPAVPIVSFSRDAQMEECLALYADDRAAQLAKTLVF